MKALLTAASLMALLVTATACYRTTTPPQSATAGAGWPTMSNPTTDSTAGTATGIAPPGANGTLVPGNQTSGSSTGQAGGGGAGGGM